MEKAAKLELPDHIKDIKSPLNFFKPSVRPRQRGESKQIAIGIVFRTDDLNRQDMNIMGYDVTVMGFTAPLNRLRWAEVCRVYDVVKWFYLDELIARSMAA